MDGLVAGEVALVAEGGLAAITLVRFVTVGLQRVPLEGGLLREAAVTLIAEEGPILCQRVGGDTSVSTRKRCRQTEPISSGAAPRVKMNPHLTLPPSHPPHICRNPKQELVGTLFSEHLSSSYGQERRQLNINVQKGSFI